MYERIKDIEKHLVIAKEMLDKVDAFDGTLNGVSINDFNPERAHIVDTINMLAMDVQNNLTEIMEHLTQAMNFWNETDVLEADVQVMLANATEAQMDIDRVESSLNGSKANLMELRRNFTDLSVKARNFHNQLATLNDSYSDAYHSSNILYTDIEDLQMDFKELREQIDSVLFACPVVNDTGVCAELCTTDPFSSADNITVCTEGQRCCSNGCGHECMDTVNLVQELTSSTEATEAASQRLEDNKIYLLV